MLEELRQIHTPHLTLVAATPAMLRAELESPHALARALGGAVPSSWPPELYDTDAIRFMLAWLLANPTQPGWGFYYIVIANDAVGAPPITIGAGGYKGAPDADGAVEIGAHTLVDLTPSIAVLRSSGFSFGGPGTDPQEPSAIQYVLTRDAYFASKINRHSVRIVHQR